MICGVLLNTNEFRSGREPGREGNAMSIQSDRWIREQATRHGMIEPFSEEQVPPA